MLRRRWQGLQIRAFKSTDIHQVVSLFYETVHAINVKDYSSEQLDAWAPREEFEAYFIKWNESLAHHITYVAEINDNIVGFSDMTYDGYLDRLFVHKDFQRQGIATALVAKLEAEARKLEILDINTAASITAKSFFESQGYKVMKAQVVERRSVSLPNFQMSKKLTAQ